MLAGIREIVTISLPESIENVYACSTAAINSVSLCPIRLSSFMSEPITEAETTFRKVFKGPDREAARRSKDTANRVLSIVKALLNHAFRDPTNGISDDHAWRLVKPFRGVAVPTAVHFSLEQARVLIEAAPDKDFANLLTAGHWLLPCEHQLPHAGPKRWFVLGVGHWPRHRLRTALSTMQWPLSCAKHPIRQSGSSMNPRWRESPGDTARIAALSAKQAPMAIIGCPHLTIPGRSYGD
jgi:hypothetical protein